MTKTKYLEIQSSLDSHTNGDDNIKNNDHIENGYTNCFDDYIKDGCISYVGNYIFNDFFCLIYIWRDRKRDWYYVIYVGLICRTIETLQIFFPNWIFV